MLIQHTICICFVENMKLRRQSMCRRRQTHPLVRSTRNAAGMKDQLDYLEKYPDVPAVENIWSVGACCISLIPSSVCHSLFCRSPGRFVKIRGMFLKRMNVYKWIKIVFRRWSSFLTFVFERYDIKLSICSSKLL